MKIGDYHSIRKLAHGGVADIYLVKGKSQQGLEKYFVCKCIKADFGNDREFLESILNETRLAKGLHHPNILEIFDLCIDQGQAFLAMEYMDAQDLRALLDAEHERGQKMPEAMAIYVISQAALGLHYAHELQDENGAALNLVHRDISPSNILFSSRGSIKISDFGIAKTSKHQNQTPTDVIKGKFNYMSPEQAWADPLDRRSDIFSLGASLYEALCGQALYPLDNVAQTIECARLGVFVEAKDLVPDLAPALIAILNKALELDKNLRYATALDFYLELTAYAESQRYLTTRQDWRRYLGEVIKLNPSLPRMHRDDFEKRKARFQVPSRRDEQNDSDVTEQVSMDSLSEELLQKALDSGMLTAISPTKEQIRSLERPRLWRLPGFWFFVLLVILSLVLTMWLLSTEL